MLSAKDEKITSFGQRNIKAPIINCGSGNRINFVCTNKDCLFDALTCTEEECKFCLPKNHQGCRQSEKFSHFMFLAKWMQEKIHFKEEIIKNMFQTQERLIKQLRENRQKLFDIKEIRDNEDMQKLFTCIFEKKTIKGFTGAVMSTLLSQLSPSNKVSPEKLKRQLTRFQKEGGRIIEGMTNLREQIFDYLTKSKNLIDSKILNMDQREYLMKQLSRPKQLKLLFRASQHNFSAAKFFQYCKDIGNTVTIIRTEFGKTIAAYTPLKWSTSTHGSVADVSLRSFLLHFELKEKMTLTRSKYAIWNNQRQSRGPIFGGGEGGSDLNIADQCNQSQGQNQNSFTNFPHFYNHNGKYLKNQQSITAFCGNPKGNQFRVVEYEVFAILD